MSSGKLLWVCCWCGLWRGRPARWAVTDERWWPGQSLPPPQLRSGPMKESGYEAGRGLSLYVSPQGKRKLKKKERSCRALPCHERHLRTHGRRQRAAAFACLPCHPHAEPVGGWARKCRGRHGCAGRAGGCTRDTAATARLPPCFPPLGAPSSGTPSPSAAGRWVEVRRIELDGCWHGRRAPHGHGHGLALGRPRRVRSSPLPTSQPIPSRRPLPPVVIARIQGARPLGRGPDPNPTLPELLVDEGDGGAPTPAPDRCLPSLPACREHTEHASTWSKVLLCDR